MSDYILINGTLYHHGILGQKWGVRRFQNPDGTLTEDGIKRYRKREDYINKTKKQISLNKKDLKSLKNYYNKIIKNGVGGKEFNDQLIIDKSDGKFFYVNMNGDKDNGYESKKHAYIGLKSDLKLSIENTEDSIQKKEKEVKIILNTPISEKSFIDNIELGKKAGVVSGVITAGLSTAALYKAIGLVGSVYLSPVSLLMGALTGVEVMNATEKFGVKKEYRR